MKEFIFLEIIFKRNFEQILVFLNYLKRNLCVFLYIVFYQHQVFPTFTTFLVVSCNIYYSMCLIQNEIHLSKNLHLVRTRIVSQEKIVNRMRTL